LGLTLIQKLKENPNGRVILQFLKV
jgi:hypothetical protein